MEMGIDALVAGAARARVAVDNAAVAIAGSGVPTVPPVSASPAPRPDGVTGEVDVAEQLVVMMSATGVHQATIAALRSALVSYRAAVDLVRP